MRRIEVEGTRMSRLVEDLLVLARGDQDAPTRHDPVEIDDLLSDAASDTGAAHPERSLSVLPSGGAVVMGDRDQLRRALVNLLNNAALHTAPGGPIRLEGVVGSTAAGPTVAIRVIDQGPGLPPEEAAHVFERFWRADKARSRAKGGSGLGMAIVAQIVKANNGTVTFDSTEQAGTTVTVLLPMAFEQPPLPTAE
jgi:two-component system OmpR family sensor kinase